MLRGPIPQHVSIIIHTTPLHETDRWVTLPAAGLLAACSPCGLTPAVEGAAGEMCGSFAGLAARLLASGPCYLWPAAVLEAGLRQRGATCHGPLQEGIAKEDKKQEGKRQG